MAIDKLFDEQTECRNCAPVPFPVLPPPTTNKAWYIGENSNWWLDGKDSGKPSRGLKGDDGEGNSSDEQADW